ncbi:hypothetical protein ACFZAG_37970 [Streptomyces sp. NPDC012403]|uniref:hypothetical protein n=1 Tax=unclassified Streptomyces TaxID=2593676 RepID=UPI001C238915|nr:hypothetical protein [Streptomyces sp. AC558_RSS880]
MVPASRAAHDIEVTAGSLQEDLSRLELQKQALERELAAVVAHLDTVQRALGALEVMMAASTEGRAAANAVDTGRHRAARPAEAEADTLPTVTLERKYGKLTEQIMDYFAQVGDTDVRARDVAVALGRATDSGSINAVRSTLDRLVGASRIRRAGRGLYRAS